MPVCGVRHEISTSGLSAGSGGEARFLDEFKIREIETNRRMKRKKTVKSPRMSVPARSFFSRNKVRNRSITEGRLFQGSLGKPCSPHQE
jgi:hypothetical protein